MKNLTKADLIAKKPYLPSNRHRLSDKPIKIVKERQNQTLMNGPILLSSINQSKCRSFYLKKDIREKSVGSKSRDRNNNILFSSSSTRLPPKSNQSQSNWYTKTDRNPFKLSKDNESIGLDQSESLARSQTITIDNKPQLSQPNSNCKTLTQLRKINNIKKDNSNANNNYSNHNEREGNGGKNTLKHINIFHKRNHLRDLNNNNNNNKNNNHCQQYNNRHNDTSTFLNYELGNTNNYTQLDEILLETNNNNNSNLNINNIINSNNNNNNINSNNNNNNYINDYNDNDNPPQNLPQVEMEIDLSKASICFDSFLQSTKIKDVIKIRHDHLNKINANYIFSNNSVYHLDTNEFIEGERKNEIYLSTPKENISAFKPYYCLTEANICLSHNQPKKERSNIINVAKSIAKTSDHCSNSINYRKVNVKYYHEKAIANAKAQALVNANASLINANTDKVKNHFRDSIKNYK